MIEDASTTAAPHESSGIACQSHKLRAKFIPGEHEDERERKAIMLISRNGRRAHAGRVMTDDQRHP
jgi:hypothetical protein